MSLDEDLLRQLMASFREELTERLAAINAGLLALEQGPAQEHRTQILEELFRHVHSLKGAARAVNLKPIEELAHGMEDVFGAAKRGSIRLTSALFDLLYQGLDLIGAAMAGAESGQGVAAALDLPGYLVRLAETWRGQPVQPPQIEEAAAPGQPPIPAEPVFQPWTGESVRVPTARLDDLMAEAGELLVTRLRFGQQVEELKELYTFLTRWQREWQQVRGNVARSLRDTGDGHESTVLNFLERNEDHLRTLIERMGKHVRRVSDDAARLSLVTDKIQEGVRQARMLPLANLLGTFRRMVRDLAREKGVEVVLEIRGAETEMDKYVLETLKDPLMHLLRNCIDHGIEPPAEREKRGKPRRGTITLSAERHGNVIGIVVADDGGGIDAEAVRRAAVRRGILGNEEAAALSEQEVLPLVFTSGLSTSTIITEVSGRGIGLDVVRRNVESLQGRVEVSTRRGRGTIFTLTFPLTLVSTRCLLVKAAGQTYAVPLQAVERLITVSRGGITTVEGKEAIRHQGRPLSLVRMADVLRLRERGRPLSEEEACPAVILGDGGQQMAFLVDELLGEQEVVVKNLGRQLARVPNVGGATVLGTGQIVLILNVTDLVKSAQRTAGLPLLPAEGEPEEVEERKVVLIVDDSITTRTLEKNILTTAGYEVRLATDGQEALAALTEGMCDLVVADLTMPRMDGFELTRRLKQDERYQDLPVILVTSLGSPEDKAHGIEVGADAYIVKGAFDQDVLLDTIRQLI